MSTSPRKASLAIIFGIVVIDLLGFGIVIPQLGIYAVKFKATSFEVGLLQSVFSLMQFAFAPFWGRLSDRFGRRPILLVSVAGSFFGYVLFAFSNSLEMLFLARIIDGVSGANISTAQAYVADVTTKENRAKGMGLVGAAFGIGFLFGPAVGGILGSLGGSRAIGLGAGALCLLNWVLAFFFLPESLDAQHRSTRRSEGFFTATRAFFERLTLPVTGKLLVLFFVFTLAFAQMEGTLSIFVLKQYLLQGVSSDTAGLFTAVSDDVFQAASLKVSYLFIAVGLVASVVQGFLMPKLRRRWGESLLAFWGLAFAAIGMVTIPMSPVYGALFPSMAILALGSGLTNPTLSALMSLHAPPNRQGEMLGAFQSMGALGRIAGPALGGALFSAFTPKAPFWVAGLLLVLAWGLAGQLRRALRGVMGGVGVAPVSK